MNPHHQTIAPISILAEIAWELTKIHPIELKPSLTPPKFTSLIHRRFGSNYGASPSTDNAKWSLTTRLLPSLQLSRKLLENLRRSHPIKREPSLAPPKIHLNWTMPFWKQSRLCSRHPRIHNGPSQLGHNQGIGSTPIFVEIALEVTKIHPIKRDPSPTPPRIHLDHTLPFRKQSRRCRYPPTTTNDSSPPGYCQHSNSCKNYLRTCKDTSNLVRGPTYTFQNHTTIFFDDQSLTNCHNTISSHNAPSLTALSPFPNPPWPPHTGYLVRRAGTQTRFTHAPQARLIDARPKAVGLRLTTNPWPQRTKSQTRHLP
jgi:hypothetical protein